MKTMKVRTICGDVAPDALQCTLAHEHLLVHYTRNLLDQKYVRERRYLPEFNRRIYRALAELKKYRCNALIEATPIMPTRHPLLWREVAERSGLHIIASTGAYAEASIPRWLRRLDEDALVELMISEIEEGMDGTNLRAGIIKLASSPPSFHKYEKKMFQAAILVQRQLGVPITTHAPLVLGEQLRFFLHHKVDLEKVTLGHVEVCSWPEIKDAARAGIGLTFTNIGGEKEIPEEIIVQQVAKLVRSGHVKQIMLSVDQALYINFEKKNLEYHFPCGYAHVFKSAVPKLMKAGVKAREIDQMLIENPRRFLAW